MNSNWHIPALHFHPSRAGMAMLVALVIGAGTLATADRAPSGTGATDAKTDVARSDAPKATAFARDDDAAEEVREATEAWERVMGSTETAVPQSVLARVKAIGIFGNVVQAAFIAGGRGGDGVIVARTDRGWGSPAFFRLGGASIGAQIGGRSTDLVLAFTSQKALDALLDDRLEFGAEVTAVVGPDAATAASAAATTADNGLLVYARDRGLFAGAALEGAVITPDNDLNRATYHATAREILTKPGAPPPSVAQPLLDALAKHTRARS
jgi:lipid-binding SYLF domain-containing protein